MSKRKPKRAHPKAKKKPPVQQLPVLAEHVEHPDEQNCPACQALRLAASRIDDIEDILRVRFGGQLSDPQINGTLLAAALDWALTFVGAGGPEEFDEPYRSLLRVVEAARSEPRSAIILPILPSPTAN